ncbi:MAG: chemotaxis protein CheW [Pseudomonadota bacterium]
MVDRSIDESAKEVGQEDALQDQQAQYLTVRLGEESYALGLLSVKEIIEYGGVTQVPMMPPYVRGVINLRGRVVPVVDLMRRLHGQPAELNRRSCIVIVEVGTAEARQDMGVIVDAVSQVVDIPASMVEPGPSFGARLRADFIAGMGRREGGFVIMLDIERVLNAEDISALGELAAASV